MSEGGDPSHYDVAIIGAGLSGLAAGARLAHFGYRICVFERHYRVGGLGSYYSRGAHEYDVGLHALTNYPPPGDRSAPWPRLLRQLRIPADRIELRPHSLSEIRFRDRVLRFTNEPEFFFDQIRETFPEQIDGFRLLLDDLPDYGTAYRGEAQGSAREALARRLSDPLLIDMLMCPASYYGSATEGDMPFGLFAVLFRSIFLEGLSRPAGGARTILEALVETLGEREGELRLKSGVRRVEAPEGGPVALTLDGGETVTASKVLSSAGYPETIALCGGVGGEGAGPRVGALGYSETIFDLDTPPADLGIETASCFFCGSERFEYRRPDRLVDYRSGLLCCPSNFRDPDAPDQVRFSLLANRDLWAALSPEEYGERKAEMARQCLEQIGWLVPDFSDRVVATDSFTPLTIERYTGRLGGAIYGTPDKSLDGNTPFPNVFLCGTDQGMVGIVGAISSGLAMANAHVVYPDSPG